MNYTNIKKEKVYVLITQLIENIIDYNSFVAYKTNVTDISEVSSELDNFELSFSDSKKFKCGFRKYGNFPLLLLCIMNEVGTFSLAEIKEEIILKDVNIKYEFIVVPVKNKEYFYCKSSDRYFYINYVFSEVLDFSSSDSLTIEYYFDKHPWEVKGLTFNKNATDLECIDSGKIKKCKVPKSHFEGKSGYYFIMHSNHLNGKSFSYEVRPIKVILEGTNNENNTFIIIISIIIVIIILAVIIFLICLCRKRVKSSDIEVGKETNDMGL